MQAVEDTGDNAPPILLWFRRDLRLADHAALRAAVDTGRPIIPVFVKDAAFDGLGAAPKWRLGLSLASFQKALKAVGSRLILRSGSADEVISDLLRETGATSVYWSRLYDPPSIDRDTRVKAMLKARGVDAHSFAGHLLFEPWTVETGSGGHYRVYTPFWKTVRSRGVEVLLAPPSKLARPRVWPKSEALADWKTAQAMERGEAVVRSWVSVGEEAALQKLDTFCAEKIDTYGEMRDVPASDAPSGLSENLTYGEISPARCWYMGEKAHQEGKAGGERFLKELVWREFAYHLMFHSPHILTRNWREEWDGFPWKKDPDHPHVRAWKQGRTGIRFVDAAMREMYVTGRMHNRARMIAASYLTKHLLTDWRIGMEWFAECLTDWDPASNAMGWQWVAGSGPDAAPYFRVFNPETQLAKFDADRAYARRWIAELSENPPASALAFFDAVPRRWNLSPDTAFPSPIVTAEDGRRRALTAYETRDF